MNCARRCGLGLGKSLVNNRNAESSSLLTRLYKQIDRERERDSRIGGCVCFEALLWLFLFPARSQNFLSKHFRDKYTLSMIDVMVILVTYYSLWCYES